MTIDGNATIESSFIAAGDIYIGVDPGRRADDVCPYPGLEAFDEDSSRFFFGREREVDSLVQRLSSRRFTAVVGPSGVGKSSLLRAGVLPRLRNGGLGTLWQIVELVPSPYLADALASVDASRPVIVWVDQAELMLEPTNHPEVAAAVLVEMVSPLSEHLHVVVTLRSDFQNLFEPYRELMSLIDDNIERLAPLDDAARRAIIELPARAAGLRVEEGLVDEVLRHIGSDRSSLPLLAFALQKTWEHRFDNALTIEGYRASGGVERAVQQQAEVAYHGLGTVHGQDFAAWAFRMRLTHQGIGPEPTRRPASMDELRAGPGGSDQVDVFVHTFVDARLLRRAGSDETATIEVCHEALLRAWTRLREWLRDDRELRILGSWLSEAAAEWLAADRSDDALRPEPRAERADYAVRNGLLSATATESEFLSESLLLQLRRRARDRRFRQLRVIAAGAAALLVIAAVVVVITIRNLDSEKDLRRVAQTLRLAAAARADSTTDRDRALLLAVEASQRDPLNDGRGALLDVLAAPGPSTFLRGRDGMPVTGLAPIYTENKVLALVADGRDTVRVVDSATGVDVIAPVESGVSPTELIAVTPRSGRVFAASKSGSVTAIDLSSRRAELLPSQEGGRITALVAGEDLVAVVGVDGSVTGWKVPTGQSPWVIRPFGDASATSVAISTDGRSLLLGSDRGELGWWDLASGRWVAPPVTASANPVFGVAVRQIDGRDVVLAVGTGELVRWDAPAAPTVIPAGRISAADWMNNDTAVVGMADGTIVELNLNAGVTTGQVRLSHHGVVTDIHATATGAVLSQDDEGQGITWPRAGLSPIVDIGASAARSLTSVTYGPLGPLTAEGVERIAAINPDQTARQTAEGVHLGDERSPIVLGVPTGRKATALAASAAGAVALGLDDGTVLIRRPNGEQITLSHSGGSVSALAISPDGRLVAAGALDTDDPTSTIPIYLWDLANGTVKQLPGHELYVSALAFSPDGRSLASGSDDRTVHVWDVSGREEAVFLGHTDMVLAIEWATNDLLVSGDQDGGLRLWDVDQQGPIGTTVLSGVDGPIVDLAINSAGDQLAVAQGHNLVTLPFGWDVLRGRACDAAARDLSEAERELFIEGPLHDTCT